MPLILMCSIISFLGTGVFLILTQVITNRIISVCKSVISDIFTQTVFVIEGGTSENPPPLTTSKLLNKLSKNKKPEPRLTY